MPCDTITTAEIKLSESTNPELLKLAMADLGVRSWAYSKGLLQINRQAVSDELIAKVKVAYSRQVVFSQAKKFGWQMKEVGQNKYQVVRR